MFTYEIIIINGNRDEVFLPNWGPKSRDEDDDISSSGEGGWGWGWGQDIFSLCPHLHSRSRIESVSLPPSLSLLEKKISLQVRGSQLSIKMEISYLIVIPTH